MFNWKKVYFCSICCALVAFSTPTITNAYNLTKPQGTAEHDDSWFLGEVELEAYTISDFLGPRALPIVDTEGWKHKGPGALTTPSIWIDIPEPAEGVSTTAPAGVLSFGGGFFWNSASNGNDKKRYAARDLKDYVNLQAVGAYAFESVPERTDGPSEITVPDKCNQIEEYAWKYCTFLKKVTFLCPNITYMSPLAFEGCYDTLEEVRIAAGNTTKAGLKQNIDYLKSAGQRAGLSDNPKDWTESDREVIKPVVVDPVVNTVTDFVATFEGHGFSWTIKKEANGQRFIVLRKSPFSVNNNSVDISEKENVLKENLVYSSKGISVLRDDIVVQDPEGNDLDPNEYDIYLRWTNKETGESSEWVKYENKDSLKVRDPGTYTIQYVVRYKGDDPDLKSNPEGLEVSEDESGGIQIEINDPEEFSENMPGEPPVPEPSVEPQGSNEDDISNSDISDDDSSSDESDDEESGDDEESSD